MYILNFQFETTARAVLAVLFFAGSFLAGCNESARTESARTTDSLSASVTPPTKDCEAAVKRNINSIIIKNWSRKESDIVPQARLTEDLGADDLDIVEAIIEIEVALKISIPDDVAEKIKTVGDFYQVAIKRSCDHK